MVTDDFDKGFDARWEAGMSKAPKGMSKEFYEGWDEADREIETELRTPTED